MIKALLNEDDILAAIFMRENLILDSLLQVHACHRYDQLLNRVQFPVYYNCDNRSLTRKPTYSAKKPIYLPHENRYDWIDFSPTITVCGADYCVADILDRCEPVQVVQNDLG